jgi:hypothetical protein
LKRLAITVILLAGGAIVASSWLWTTWTPAKSTVAPLSDQIEGKTAVRTVTDRPISAQTTRPLSDRQDPLKIFEAIEGTNVTINFWGKVVDQDSHALGAVTIKYGYLIEHGNMLGVAWSDEEQRTGEVVTDGDGLFSIQGLKGHYLTIESIARPGYLYREKRALIYNFYGSTSSGKFVPDEHRPIVLTMVEKVRMEPLVHVKGSLRVRGDGTPQRWSLWQGELDPNGEFAVTLRRDPLVLERPGQAATWSADLQIIGGGVIEAPPDEEVRRAPESGYVETVAYPKLEQKEGVPYRSFYVKTADGKFGRIQVELDPYSQGETARCAIEGDMNPRPGSRNLEPAEED